MHVHTCIQTYSRNIFIIYIVYPNSPALTGKEVLHYLSDRAIVALEWTPEQNVLYNISGIPQTSVSFTGNASVQLTVFYNILYNVSVVATRCGQNTTVVELKLGNDHIFLLCMSN